MSALRLALAIIVLTVGVTSPRRRVASAPGLGGHEDRAPRKTALIIAIGNYPAAGGYPRINSVNDVPLVVSALNRHHFRITVLADRDATHNAILVALANMIREANAGDIVVIHYSGHGHQITDDDGDEIDGYDELLVPYDAPNFAGFDHPGYKGEQHIRDDSLAKIIASIRQKIGPTGNVVFSLDACFSGSGTRGTHATSHAIRGVARPIGAPARTIRDEREQVDSVIELLSSRASNASAAPLIVFSATREDQVDEEINDGESEVGPLSFALAKYLTTANTKETYTTLFSRVRVEMKARVPGQDPQLEGTPDVRLFGGLAVDQRPFLNVSVRPKSFSVSLDGGTLLGISPGSEVEFHRVGTAAPSSKTIIARGVVTAADALESQVRLSRDAVKLVAGSWAFVTRYKLAASTLRFRVDSSVPPSAASAAIAAAMHSGLANVVVNDADVTLERYSPSGRPTEMFAVTVPGGARSSLVQAPFANNAETLATAVTDRLRAVATTRQLMSLPIRDPSLPVTLRLIPARLTFSGGRCAPDTVQATSASFRNGSWYLHDAKLPSNQPPERGTADGYILEIRNASAEALYVTVLDLTSDYSIGRLFPRPEESSETNRIAPRKNYVIKGTCFFPTPPFGSETLMLFATRAPVNFALIMTPTARRGELSDVEKALADVFDGSRSGSANTRRGAGTMFPIHLVIAP